MALKEKDFVEITYTGKLQEDASVFDTSDEALAKEHHIYRQGAEYGPIIICLGQGQLLKGLDEALIGQDLGKHSIKLGTEQAFGKKEPKLVTMIPLSKFKDQKINPVVGLRLNIDGMIGIIKSVGGGRTIVDFNHPLAGKDVEYEVEVKRVVTDLKEQVEALLHTFLGMPNPKVEVKDGKATIEVPEKFPEQLKGLLSEKIKDLTSAKDIELKEAKPLNKPDAKKE